MKEFRITDSKGEIQVGQRFKVDLFQVKEKVDVSGVSKGKGFAGVIVRHHFRGGAATHGSMFHRAPGSIGGSSFPSRVFPGMRGAGRMGGDRVTLRNLTVVDIDAENNLMLVEGAIPGPKGSYVEVRKAKSGHGAKAIRHRG
jgi:large subunit ribosomal protein L3